MYWSLTVGGDVEPEKVVELVVVGDLKEQEALEKLAFMNKWESKDVRMPELPAALGYEVVDVSEKGDILEPVKEDVCGTEEGSN